jgi:glycosyltransferase involved in cell wall biosynthesis
MLPKVREHLEARGMAPHKLHIIPNGADPDEWPAPAELPAGIAADRPMALGESVRKPRASTGTASRSGIGSARRAAATGPILTLVTSSPKTAATPGASPAPARAAPGPASTAVATLLRSAGPPPAPAAPSLAQLPPELSRLLGQLREQGKTIVAYTGSHGLANALDTLLDAARLVHDQPLAFLLVGAGPEKERLQQQAQRRELAQVHFAAPVAKRHMPALLGNIDIAFLGWQRQPLYRFGIAPNKLLDYMMAGCPVLHAVDAGNDPVAEAGCGVSVAPEDPAALAHGLLRLLELGPEQRRLLGARGRRYALSHLTYPVLAQRFLNVLAQETPHG